MSRTTLVMVAVTWAGMAVCGLLLGVFLLPDAGMVARLCFVSLSVVGGFGVGMAYCWAREDGYL